MFEGEQLSGEKQLEHLERVKMLLRKVRSVPEKLWPLFEHVIERNWESPAQATGITITVHLGFGIQLLIDDVQKMN